MNPVGLTLASFTLLSAAAIESPKKEAPNGESTTFGLESGISRVLTGMTGSPSTANGLVVAVAPTLGASITGGFVLDDEDAASGPLS